METTVSSWHHYWLQHFQCTWVYGEWQLHADNTDSYLGRWSRIGLSGDTRSSLDSHPWTI